MKNEKRPVRGNAAEKCSECGAEMEVRVSTAKDPYPYKMSGLANVRLVGVKILICGACGDEAVQIPRVGELHRAIAHTIFHKPGLLSGDEVRFLRKNAGVMAKDFAASIGISPEHLSRIENGKTGNLGEAADKLARLVAMAPCSKAEEIRSLLRSAGAALGAGAIDEKNVFQLKNSGWAKAA